MARLLQGAHDRAARTQDDFRSECDQLLLANAIGLTIAPADVDAQVMAVTPAQFLQFSQKCRDLNAGLQIAFSNLNEHTDPHAVALLRTRCKRPSRWVCSASTERRSCTHSTRL